MGPAPRYTSHLLLLTNLRQKLPPGPQEALLHTPRACGPHLRGPRALQQPSSHSPLCPSAVTYRHHCCKPLVSFTEPSLPRPIAIKWRPYHHQEKGGYGTLTSSAAMSLPAGPCTHPHLHPRSLAPSLLLSHWKRHLLPLQGRPGV